MPDKYGRFKGISVPAAAEHIYEVHDQLGNTLEQVPRFYFSCRCGVCGPLKRDRLVAAEEGRLHVEAARERNA